LLIDRSAGDEFAAQMAAQRLHNALEHRSQVDIFQNNPRNIVNDGQIGGVAQ
jgi:hypothetical protein